jgi:hypothetical protein
MPARGYQSLDIEAARLVVQDGGGLQAHSGSANGTAAGSHPQRGAAAAGHSIERWQSIQDFEREQQLIQDTAPHYHDYYAAQYGSESMRRRSRCRAVAAGAFGACCVWVCVGGGVGGVGVVVVVVVVRTSGGVCAHA